MDRRTFIGTTSAAALMTRFGWTAREHKIEKIGLELYTVRDAMQKDFEGTLRAVAELGYSAVELVSYFGTYGLSSAELKRTLADLGLTPIGVHVGSDALANRFDETHETRFGHANPGAPIEFVAVRSTGFGDLGRAEPQRFEPVEDASYPYEERQVTFGRREQTTCVSRRSTLPAGAVVEGPAVVIEETATTIVSPGSTARVDGFGTLVIEIGAEDS